MCAQSGAHFCAGVYTKKKNRRNGGSFLGWAVVITVAVPRGIEPLFSP